LGGDAVPKKHFVGSLEKNETKSFEQKSFLTQLKIKAFLTIFPQSFSDIGVVQLIAVVLRQT